MRYLRLDIEYYFSSKDNSKDKSKDEKQKVKNDLKDELNKKKGKIVKRTFAFLDEAILEGSEDAVSEKYRILTELEFTNDSIKSKLDPAIAFKALERYHERYKRGEEEQTSNEIINLLNYILNTDTTRMKIPSDIIYNAIEIQLNRKAKVEEIENLFEQIPEEERTNHSINFRFIEYSLK